MVHYMGLGPKPIETHVLHANSCLPLVQGGAKGGPVLGGSNKISGKLKFIYFIHFTSKLKKNNVLHITSCLRRVQGVEKGGPLLAGLTKF